MKNNKGFTLVELAIVLVIIGLLVGGVLQGQELIRQAQIRNVLAQLRDFDVGVNTFRAKYGANALPGDFAQAAQFNLDHPNLDSASGENVSATANTDNNGDGDGLLDDTAGAATLATVSGEIYNFWVHLSNASLVKGSFSQATPNDDVGTAYPSTAVGTGALALTDNGGRVFYVIGVASEAADLADVAGLQLTPEEAYSIDSKADNGEPNTGGTQAIDDYTASFVFDTTIAASSTGCVTGTAPAQVYNVSNGGKTCTIRVRASS